MLTNLAETNVNSDSLTSSETAFEQVAHDLRQPLSVIEALAYYLEMTSKDEAASQHLRRIQAMVLQANQILSKACQR